MKGVGGSCVGGPFSHITNRPLVVNLFCGSSSLLSHNYACLRECMSTGLHTGGIVQAPVS